MSEASKRPSSSQSDPGRACLPSGAGSPGNKDSRDDKSDKVVCERCGQAEMFRMHAVWRCPGCGYKTDCCGW